MYSHNNNNTTTQHNMISQFFVWLDGCGGSLIAPNVVLTAGHCLGMSDQVTLGLHKMFLSPGEQSQFWNVEHIPIAEVKRHPNYNDDSLDNDFMLLRLEYDSVQYADKVIPLDTDGLNNEKDTEFTVIGFGKLSTGGFNANVMQNANVNYINNEDCGKYDQDEILDSMMCAGRDGKDACQVRLYYVCMCDNMSFAETVSFSLDTSVTSITSFT